jgi:hypothetical protein
VLRRNPDGRCSRTLEDLAIMSAAMQVDLAILLSLLRGSGSRGAERL